MNKLYFGDNLDILREHIASEPVDLIYLNRFLVAERRSTRGAPTHIFPKP